MTTVIFWEEFEKVSTRNTEHFKRPTSKDNIEVTQRDVKVSNYPEVCFGFAI